MTGLTSLTMSFAFHRRHATVGLVQVFSSVRPQITLHSTLVVRLKSRMAVTANLHPIHNMNIPEQFYEEPCISHGSG